MIGGPRQQLDAAFFLNTRVVFDPEAVARGRGVIPFQQFSIRLDLDCWN